MKPSLRNKSEVQYECDNCGAIADGPEECCTKPMKPKESQTFIQEKVIKNVREL